MNLRSLKIEHIIFLLGDRVSKILKPYISKGVDRLINILKKGTLIVQFYYFLAFSRHLKAY